MIRNPIECYSPFLFWNKICIWRHLGKSLRGRSNTARINVIISPYLEDLRILWFHVEAACHPSCERHNWKSPWLIVLKWGTHIGGDNALSWLRTWSKIKLAKDMILVISFIFGRIDLLHDHAWINHPDTPQCPVQGDRAHQNGEGTLQRHYWGKGCLTSQSVFSAHATS